MVWRYDPRTVISGFETLMITAQIESPCDSIESVLGKRTRSTTRLIDLCRELHKIYFLDELNQLCPTTNSLNSSPKGEMRKVGPIQVGIKTYGMDTWKEFSMNNSNPLKEFEEISVLSYLTGQLTAKFVESQAIMRHAQEEWSKGKIPFTFFQFLEIEISCGSTTCPLHYALPVSCSMPHTYDSFQLQVVVPVPATNATAFVADPIHFGYETENKVCTIKYAGPDTMIEVGNCVMPGVDTLNHYYGVILMPNYSCDPDSPALAYVLNLFFQRNETAKLALIGTSFPRSR